MAETPRHRATKPTRRPVAEQQRRRCSRRIAAAAVALALPALAPQVAFAGSVPPPEPHKRVTSPSPGAQKRIPVPSDLQKRRAVPSSDAQKRLAESSCPEVSGIRGSNPSLETVSELIEQVAAAHDQPPEVLKAIAWSEGWDYQSGRHWAQFHADGTPVVSPDCGTGLMQLTGATEFDERRLASDIAYNVDAGATVLDEKWAMANSSNPSAIGEDDRSLLENWYYPIYLYNGRSGSPTYPDLIVSRMRDPNLMPDIASYTSPVAFTRPQEALPDYSFGEAFQARTPGVFVTYTGDASITERASAPVHPWNSGCFDYGEGVYGPDGCGGGFAFTGPIEYWWADAALGLRGRMRWTWSNGSTESNGATWSPPIATGTYQVLVYVPAHDATANARYTVTHASGVSERVVHQLSYSDAWVSLGTFATREGSIPVHVSDAGDASHAGKVAVDALRYVRVG